MEFDFDGRIIEWRGPAPYHYIALPDWAVAQVDLVAKAVSYGWGVIPVQASIGETTWTTSLFPKDGGYLLPVKAAVRQAESLALESPASVRLRLVGL